jgi:UPF0716 protein FxsA
MGDAARMGRLIALFVILPAVELALLIQLGARIGTGATILIIMATGIIGASLARRQGLGVLRDLQRDTAEGRLPAGSLIDGVIILIAGALLVTPGVLTDLFGFACLVPAFRAFAKRIALGRLERAVQEGRVELHVHTQDPWGPREEREVRDLRDVGPGGEG